MEQKSILFIGGPWDGRLVQQGDPHLNRKEVTAMDIPLQAGTVGDYGGPGPGTITSVRAEYFTYTRQSLCGVDFFIPDEWYKNQHWDPQPVAEKVLAKLIAGYAGSIFR